MPPATSSMEKGSSAVLRAALLGDPRVEDDLEQYVAELLAQFVAVAVLDGLDEFVRLLDAVLRQALVGLLRRTRGTRARMRSMTWTRSRRRAPGRSYEAGSSSRSGIRTRPEPASRARPSVRARVALAGRHDDDRPAAGAGVDQVLGGRRGLVDRDARLPQIRQLRVRRRPRTGPGRRACSVCQAGQDSSPGATRWLVVSRTIRPGSGGGSWMRSHPERNPRHRQPRCHSLPPVHSGARIGTTRTDNRYAVAVTPYPLRRLLLCGEVTSRSHGVFASTRLLFSTSQLP